MDRTYTRVELAPAKIRYNYSTPSMSRRGGVKLRPIEDGVANPGNHLQYPLTRDTFGHKLVDVINPLTGFCTGVRSTGFSRPNNEVGFAVKPGVSGSHNAETRRAYIRATSVSGVWLDSEDRVIRTVSMGDDPLPGRPPSNHTETPKKKGTRQMAAVPATRGRRPAPVLPPITDDDCRTLIRKMAKGKTVTNFTPQMMKLARGILAKKYAEMIKHTTPKKGNR